jgi:hypothetical protein
MGTWPRLDGAPPPVSQENKSYDASRRKMAHFLGMDFLFTQREYFQSVQTDSGGRQVLVNSTKRGEITSMKEVPQNLRYRDGLKGKFKFPRNSIGIPKLQERVEKLSCLLHVVTTHGIPTRAILKSLRRLSLIWYNSRYEDMRKHVFSLTLGISRSAGFSTRSLGATKKVLLQHPRFTGEKYHENGIKTPLWSRVPTAK